MAYDVFISYSRKDLSLIEPLVKDIEKRANVKCWIDWNGIKSGSQFEDVIIKAIDSVKVVLFFLSENSMNSKHAKMEVNYADNTRKTVVPIVLDGGSLRGWFLYKFGAVDYIDVNQERQYNKLINDLIGWCGTSTPTPIPQPKSAPTSTSTSTSTSTPKPKRFDFKKWRKPLLSVVAALVLIGGVIGAVVATMQPQVRKYRAGDTYKIGDIVRRNGVKGVVFEVTDGGRHGKMVSVKQSYRRWSSDVNEQERLIWADDKYNGANNMAKVKQIADWRDKYPAFAWCADLGEEWYLPAKEELLAIYCNKTIVERAIYSRGGRLSDYYLSSTETNYQYGGKFCAWCVDMGNGYTYGKNCKDSRNYVRAVSAF